MPHIRPRAFSPTTSASLNPVDKTLDAKATGKSNAGGNTTTELAAKIVALIPAESVAAYQSAYNLTDKGHDALFVPVVYLIIIATPAWQLYATRSKNEPYAWDQAIVSVPAFYVWLYGLQSPFIHYRKDWTSSDSGLILLLGTLLLPLVGWGLSLIFSAAKKKQS